MARILVADDEEVLRMLIVDSLEDLEVEVDEASDGKEVLEKMETNDYDLLILDYMMPILTGIEVIQALQMRKAGKRPYILMLTAKSQQKDQEEILASGADSFLAKPFSPLLFVEKVEDILSEIIP